MPRKPQTVELCNKVFLSKEDLKVYIQSILTNGCKLLTGEEACIISELLSLHPDASEKLGIGLKHIEVGRSPQKTHNCFYVVRLDGSKDNFSYKNCIEKCSQNRLIEKRRIAAYREAVQQQIIDFRFSEHNPCCQICGSTDNLQVDHEINFISLVNDFESGREYVPTTFENADGTLYSKRFLDCDAEFRSFWQQYHYNHATLRLLCQQCNLTRKGKQRYLGDGKA
jgi:5-methylcytosine-specific restriction endonuclease McrA